jgi:hypothetical protein
MMTRRWTAFVLGAALVGIVEVLGHFKLATPIPFWLLLPGILAGACVPGSGFSPEGDLHAWSPVSVFVVYAVNIGLYSVLAYLLVYPLRRHFLAVKQPNRV